MAKGFSKVILMGNLTRDPETRSTQSGASVTSFTLAVNRTWRDQSGQNQEQVSFINCVAWGKAGETIAQYMQKGGAMLVSGRLDQRAYEDKDGNKRSAVEVYVEEFNFVGGGQQGEGGQRQNTQSRDVAPDDIDDRPIDLSEIPF